MRCLHLRTILWTPFGAKRRACCFLRFTEETKDQGRKEERKRGRICQNCKQCEGYWGTLPHVWPSQSAKSCKHINFGHGVVIFESQTVDDAQTEYVESKDVFARPFIQRCRILFPFRIVSQHNDNTRFCERKD